MDEQSGDRASSGDAKDTQLAISERDWATFGKWMAVCSAIVMLTIAVYWEKDAFSLVLRIWSGFLGLYLLWALLRR